MKKIISIVMALFAVCSFASCDFWNNSEQKPEEPQKTELSAIDFGAVAGWKTTLLECNEAGMTDVNNNPLVVAYAEESLEYVKATNEGKTYDVYKYTKIERSTIVDGTNGDEALQAIDLYKYVYTVVVDVDEYYFDLYELDVQLTESSGIEYPGVSRELSKATADEKVELVEFIEKLSPQNNTVESLKTENSLGEWSKNGEENIFNLVTQKYLALNGKWEAAADKNGVLLYGREVAKTQLGEPVGKTYYPYSYALTLVTPTIEVDFSKIV